ncbi:pectinesterase 3-like [Iris pallida]|uniref:Pectinesterase n=1 Tax=Iris pallida TaxID=29817 RepID=A0AAX6GAS9_IRIPA|nr:pectinesterase 3-like [Iris pallida]
MDTVKSFKGYGKVDEADNREFQRTTRKRLILIASSAVILLVIVVGVVIGVVANKRGGGGGDDDDSDRSPSTSATSIKAMCSVTRYPDACFSSVSSLKEAGSTSDPEELFKLSLRVAADAVSRASSLPDTFAVPANDARLAAALRDCRELFDDAVGRLNDSIASLGAAAGGGKVLTDSKIGDLKSWLSAAVTDQETCLDGFEGTTGGLREKMEAAMTNSTQFTSNSLAIVAGILGILRDLDIPIHRKLLSSSSSALLPKWVLGSHRRALLQAAPGELKPNVTVAKDGSGQFATIGEAVQLVPKKSPFPFVIYVKEGVYEENVVVEKSKWNVMFFGDGMYKTVVTGSLNFIDGTPTFSTATFATVGKGFMARDMGFKNTAGPEKHQAVAFRSGADRSVYYRCSFEAFQDTLYVHALRQFYRECDISGTIDFIFGDATAVFQKCTIRPRQPLANQRNIITAQGKKDPNESTGISIQGCTIAPYSTDVTAQTYLGRPWKNYSTTIVMQTEIGAVVDREGWLAWTPGVAPPDTINYAEFQNTGPGSMVEGRVKWAGYRPEISAEEASKYTVHAFLDGSEWIDQSGATYESTL